MDLSLDTSARTLLASVTCPVCPLGGLEDELDSFPWRVCMYTYQGRSTQYIEDDHSTLNDGNPCNEDLKTLLLNPSPPTRSQCKFGLQHLFYRSLYMGVSENSGFSPPIIHFNTVFHYFHHPFWGTSILGNTPIPLIVVSFGLNQSHSSKKEVWRFWADEAVRPCYRDPHRFFF